ncbi:MAG: siroheme synthase [Novosphingobium sp.]|nr:siroheme synthase [Novosphingobium sp.]
MHSLPLFHRIAGRPVIVLGAGEAAAAKRRLVERAGGIVASEDEPHAMLAFVAIDERDAAEAAAIRLRCGGLLVNVVDRPELCDFTAPSVLERGPVLVAIATGGASAGLAKALRLRLEALLPPALGTLAEALGRARERLRIRWPDAGERRRALDAALGQGGVLDPLDSGSAERVESWLAGEHQAAPDGTVEIHLRSPDPDDLTLREARLLGAADLIAHEADVPPAILARARADAARQEIARGEGIDGQGLILLLRAPPPTW